MWWLVCLGFTLRVYRGYSSPMWPAWFSTRTSGSFWPRKQNPPSKARRPVCSCGSHFTTVCEKWRTWTNCSEATVTATMTREVMQFLFCCQLKFCMKSVGVLRFIGETKTAFGDRRWKKVERERITATSACTKSVDEAFLHTGVDVDD